MGFWDAVERKANEYQREKDTTANASRLISLAVSRNHQVECKVCKKTVSELAPTCPNCGEALPGLRIQCPKCSSQHITISKKGFHVGQAAAGGIVLGLVGLAAGMIGSKDYEFACLGCNHKWGLSKPKADSGRARVELESSGTNETMHILASDRICPYCKAKLKKAPVRKTRCPSCKKFIYVWHREGGVDKSDDIYYLITAQQRHEAWRLFR